MSISSLALVLAAVACPLIILLRYIQRKQTQKWEREQAKGPRSSPLYKTTEKEALFETAQKVRFAIYGLIGALLVVYLFFFILNIQREAPLSDISWAFLLALGLPAAGFMLYRVGAVEPVLEGVNTPSWPRVARKGLLIYVALVLLVVVLSHVIPTGFQVWPSFERNADQTGIKEFFAKNWDDPVVMFGTLAFIAFVTFGSIKRVTLIEWVWGDNKSVFPRQSAPEKTLATASSAAPSAIIAGQIADLNAAALNAKMAGRMSPFFRIVMFCIVLLFLGAAAYTYYEPIQSLGRAIAPGGSWSPAPKLQGQGQVTPPIQKQNYTPPQTAPAPERRVQQPTELRLVVAPEPQLCQKADTTGCSDLNTRWYGGKYGAGYPYSRRIDLAPGDELWLTFPELHSQIQYRLRAFGNDHVFVTDCSGLRVDLNVNVPNNGLRDDSCRRFKVENPTNARVVMYINTNE